METGGERREGSGSSQSGSRGRKAGPEWRYAQYVEAAVATASQKAVAPAGEAAAAATAAPRRSRMAVQPAEAGWGGMGRLGRRWWRGRGREGGWSGCLSGRWSDADRAGGRKGFVCVWGRARAGGRLRAARLAPCDVCCVWRCPMAAAAGKCSGVCMLLQARPATRGQPVEASRSRPTNNYWSMAPGGRRVGRQVEVESTTRDARCSMPDGDHNAHRLLTHAAHRRQRPTQAQLEAAQRARCVPPSNHRPQRDLDSGSGFRSGFGSGSGSDSAARRRYVSSISLSRGPAPHRAAPPNAHPSLHPSVIQRVDTFPWMFPVHCALFTAVQAFCPRHVPCTPTARPHLGAILPSRTSSVPVRRPHPAATL